jgi:hypothetical protein
MGDNGLVLPFLVTRRQKHTDFGKMGSIILFTFFIVSAMMFDVFTSRCNARAIFLVVD